MTRKKVGDPFPDGKGYVDEGGGRESGSSLVDSRGTETGGKTGSVGENRANLTEPGNDTATAAANPAARIRELEARIALMEQATCDVCGHKFYALEVDG